MPTPNAMEVGPDGLLYFPVMGANEIWRVDPDGGEPQRVAADLGVPDSVKFDSDGYIVSTQVASGQVLRIDPRTGEQTVLAQLNPGLDNLHPRRRAAVRLELHRRDHRDPPRRRNPHRAARRTELAARSGGGRRRQALRRRRHVLLRRRRRVAADRRHAVHARLPRLPARPGARGTRRLRRHHLGRPDRPLPSRDGETDYLADGFDQLYGVAIGADDTIVFAELGAGRVHSLRSGNVRGAGVGAADPVGVALTSGGSPLVAESGAGRVVRLTGSGPRRWSTGCSGRRASRSRTARCSSSSRRQGGRRGRPRHRCPQHDRRGPAHRSAARCGAQAAEGNPAVLGSAGTVRGHHRRPRRHAVRLGRRRRQRAGVARRA